MNNTIENFSYRTNVNIDINSIIIFLTVPLLAQIVFDNLLFLFFY